MRPATVEDESFLRQVYESTRAAELSAIDWTEEQWQAFIDMQFAAQTRCYPKADNRIILHRECPIGRILVDTTQEIILLVDIALLEPYRNAGIGSALIRELLKHAAAVGKPVGLHVLASSRAVRLYQRLGFSITSGDAAYLEMRWTPLFT
jgi:GNAT superfamily N-acetyltransferase